MTTLLTERELLEIVEVLSPAERLAAREAAIVLSVDLGLAKQQPAAWVEIAAWLLAAQMCRFREAGLAESWVEKLKEFVGRRAEQLLAAEESRSNGEQPRAADMP
jgi:hypothetical protein